ncbi:MAG: tRNA pseudouridine(38-40) synthase TruA [Actinomycetota bacterium]
MRNIKLIIEYEGTNYRGFQQQPEGSTVQGELEKALKVLLREEVKVKYASRTDAKVHATCQVVNFKTESPLEVRRIRRALNGILPGDIVIKKTEEVPLGFDARRDAVYREYVYLIWNRGYPPVLKRNFVYFVAQPLNLEAMREALKYVVGTYDFSAFCASPSSPKGCVRTVREAYIEEEDGLISLKMRANSFVHQMVRSIVGTTVEIGLGKRAPEEMKEILESGDRRLAGKTAPARALILTEVHYKERN